MGCLQPSGVHLASQSWPGTHAMCSHLSPWEGPAASPPAPGGPAGEPREAEGDECGQGSQPKCLRSPSGNK